MMMGRILRWTHTLGVKQGYKPLYVRATPIVDPVSKAKTMLQETAWIPTPEELALLNKGASIHVKILSSSHPPIKVDVGEVPDEEATPLPPPE